MVRSGCLVLVLGIESRDTKFEYSTCVTAKSSTNISIDWSKVSKHKLENVSRKLLAVVTDEKTSRLTISYVMHASQIDSSGHDAQSMTTPRPPNSSHEY